MWLNLQRRGSYITVYADILFLVHFSMDFLSLCLTGRLTSEKMSRTRTVVSAAVGGFIGTVAMLFLDGAYFVLCGILTAMLMTRIAFGKRACDLRTSALHLIRGCGILWGVGALLGGIMTSILSVGNAVYTGGGDEGFLPIFLICFFLSSAIVRLAGRTSVKRSAKITVVACGVTVTFSALCDSGCLLTEPISGRAVIIASKNVLGTLYELLFRESSPLRIRMIPADGVCGHCLLRGFLPECVKVDGTEVSAVIACDTEGGNYGGFDGIVPQNLVGRGRVGRHRQA